MPDNTPITDAELAEVKRLVAAAGLEYLKHVPGTLKDYVCGPDGDTFGFSTQRLHWNDGRDTNSENICPAIVATFNAFPGLIARLEELQAYRSEVEAAKPTVQALLDSGERAASEVADLRQRLERAEAEREELRKKNRITQAKLENMAIDCGQAEGLLKRLREDLAARDAQQRREGAAGMYVSNTQLQARAEVAERERNEALAQVADLRGALEKCSGPHLVDSSPYETCVRSCPECLRQAAIARTPAQSLGKVKAEALRETAKELESLRDHIQDYIQPDDARDDIRRICLNRAKDLRDEADRLEAANGR